MDSDLESLLEGIVNQTNNKSELNKSAIRRLVKMDTDEERFEFLKSMGSVPLDNEGRQLISCPEKKEAICHLHTVYKSGEAKTVCTGPVLDKTDVSGFLDDSCYEYKSRSARDGCPYHPKKQFVNSEDEDLEDIF